LRGQKKPWGGEGFPAPRGENRDSGSCRGREQKRGDPSKQSTPGEKGGTGMQGNKKSPAKNNGVKGYQPQVEDKISSSTIY